MRDSVIEDLDRCRGELGLHSDVLRAKIAVDYLILVEIVQCRNNLLNQKCDLLLIPRLRPRHALEHIHQNVHLTRDVGVMRVVDDAADAKHIGVKDLFKDLCLLLNALSFLLSKVLRVVRCYSL